MKRENPTPLVSTIREKCRVCYTCVRECPAKAIRISGGQAEVIAERCIGCGNCVRVCSQKAKQVLSSIGDVEQLLLSPDQVAACVAPSFPAHFNDFDHRALVAALRGLGFGLVTEVAFGADLVARAYRELLGHEQDRSFIGANCPALIEYIERYHPRLVPCLAPIVSPMIAMSRALRRLHGPGLKIVFIGPCMAKKAERDATSLKGEVDAVLTFIELDQMIAGHELDPRSLEPSGFDPPHSGQGALFPVSRGMLEAADISDGLLPGDVIAADGRINFVEAVREFEAGAMQVRLLEVLCCEGCIMGPGIDSPLPLFSRRSRVISYVRERLAALDRAQWERDMAGQEGLDLSRVYLARDIRDSKPSDDEIFKLLARMGKNSTEDELNCGACGYASCREHAVAILTGLAESEMCLPYAIDQLKKTVKELAVSNHQLASVQQALVQSEKLASMGQLAAGIAHEINNPLGVVLMYSHLLLSECADDKLKGDLSMIVEQTDRCKKIVAGLLNFARQNKVSRQPQDLPQLVERSIRALPLPGRVKVTVRNQLKDPAAEIDGDQMAQVLTNLIGNAYDAMPLGGELTISLRGDQSSVSFVIEDQGVGIPPEHLPRVFDPFFTTKQLGKGTGLGLAVAYGIVKMHGGDLKVESNADPAQGPTRAVFTVTVPRTGPQD